MAPGIAVTRSAPPPAPGSSQTPVERPSYTSTSGSQTLPTFLPTLIALSGRILQDLEMNLSQLLTLNPSRRETIAQHLDRLSGQAPGPTLASGMTDAAGGLRRWIEGPRSNAQNTALQTFFEEVALISLGQALLLKGWNDRGIRRMNEEDLRNLNWALVSSLKPLIPIDRESWQITWQNIYSWYKPSASIQREIWHALEPLRILDDVPTLLSDLIRYVRQNLPDWPELRGYDARFFAQLWKNLSAFGFTAEADSGPLKRKRMAFSPTLRDGALVRTGASALGWVGMEAYPFQLMMAELAHLWSGPCAPPLWAIGSGLEAHSRDQLSMGFLQGTVMGPKPTLGPRTLVSRISEMEACDLSFVIEERCVRVKGNTLESTRFREAVEQLDYFKKIRGAGTTLGDLQACVAVTKLRPGGLFCWIREEPLSASDGQEMLGFMLDRARLLCEWDFSELAHSLPAISPLYPRYFYLFARETAVEKRLGHRPSRVKVQGQIRSHIEVPLLFEEALQAFSSHKSQHGQSSRGHWEIHLHTSPTTQKEWAERWPDPTESDSIRKIEALRVGSMPLGSVTTVRLAHEAVKPSGTQTEAEPSHERTWLKNLIRTGNSGLWVRAEHDSDRDRRYLVAQPLSAEVKPAERTTRNTGYFVLVPDASWVAPLKLYLESEAVRLFLDHHAERKGGRWSLSEQEVKWIPVPKTLLRALNSNSILDGGLSKEWEVLASRVAGEPRTVLSALQKPGFSDGDAAQLGRAMIFVQAARALESLEGSNGKLMSIVRGDGRICWLELLNILPPSEVVGVTMHSRSNLTGSLPPHLPIGRIERVKTPTPGVLLSTERGECLHIGFDSAIFVDIIWEQVRELKHPTWSELIDYIRIPRRLDLAESTANDVLRSHGEISSKLKELTDLLSVCLKL